MKLLQHKPFVGGSASLFRASQNYNAKFAQRRRHAIRVRADAADVAGLVIFSAIPFVAVQALADSKYGKELMENLQAQKPLLEKQKQQFEKQRQAVRASLPQYFGPDRPHWLGPLSRNFPPWLEDETLPGNYGWDPIGLARQPEKLDRYVELELLHARWGMLAALGALIPELLELTGTAHFLEPVWWNVGRAKLMTNEDLNYLGIAGLKVAGGQGVAIIAFCQVLLMFGPEYARSCGITALEPLGIFLPGDKNYPGGWLFDPLGLSKKAETFEVMKVKEIKHGRLAMTAWLGFFAQAAVTQKGPLDNLLVALNKAGI